MSVAVASGRAQGTGFAVRLVRLVRLVGLIGLVGLGACVRNLPPAATPEAHAPHVQAGPPAPGQGRLIVDVVEGPTRVDRIVVEAAPREGQGSGHVELVERSVPACATTPCVLDLSLGNVVLAFPVLGAPARTEVELVHVGAEPSVYRRSLSRFARGGRGTRYVLAAIAVTVGALAAGTGVALLPIGLSKGNDDLALAGGITLGSGALLVGLGAWALQADADTYRPGSANHFALEGVR